MNTTSPKPNFFIVGAQKTGTTALAEYLRSHPDVFFSTPKEPHYFNTDLNTNQKSREWYNSLFEGAEYYKAAGEGSTRYLHSHDAIPGIMQFNPDARIIAMVRNPVDLFHSLYHHYRFTQKETTPTPRQAWELQDTRKKENDVLNNRILQYAEVCSLGENLERAYQYVPPKQMHVIFFDDFKKDTAQVYRGTLSFLNLEDDGRDSFPIVNNRRSSGIPWLDRALRTFHQHKKRMGFTKGLGHTWIAENLIFGRSKHPLPTDLRQELTAYFTQDIKKLEQLTRRDLSHWKT